MPRTVSVPPPKSVPQPAVNHDLAKKAGKPAVTVAAQERAELYASMPPALKKVADEFDKKRTGIIQTNIMARHAMGSRVVGILAEDGKENSRYGEQAVEKLAAYMDMPTNDLYNLRTFAQAYTADDITALMSRVTPGGSPLSYTHLLELSRLKAGPRKQLTAAAINEGLSAKELQRRIETVAPEPVAEPASTKKTKVTEPEGPKTRATETRGRPLTRPSSPLAGVQQVINQAVELTKRCKIWDEVVFGHFADLSPDEVNDTVAVKLAEAVDAVTNMKLQIDAAVPKLESDLRRVRRMLNANKAPGTAAAKPAAAKPVTKPVAAVTKPAPRPAAKPAPAPEPEAEFDDPEPETAVDTETEVEADETETTAQDNGAGDDFDAEPETEVAEAEVDAEA